jgi:hypothetical protein
MHFSFAAKLVAVVDLSGSTCVKHHRR